MGVMDPEIFLLSESFDRLDSSDYFQLLPPRIFTDLPLIIKQPNDYFLNVVNEITPVSGTLYLFDDSISRIAESQSFNLYVSASNPLSGSLTYVWKKDNLPVYLDRRNNSASLLIESLSLSNAGTYNCEIINEAGSVITNDIVLEVIGSSYRLFSQNVIHNGSAEFRLQSWNSPDNQFNVKDYSNESFLTRQLQHDYEFNFSTGPDALHRFSHLLFQDVNNYAAFIPHPADWNFTDLGTEYFTRNHIKFFREGGTIYSVGYQDIDVTDYSFLINGFVKGINAISLVLTGYLGTGISRVYSEDKNVTFKAICEDNCSVHLQFYNQNTLLAESNRLLSPTIKEINLSLYNKSVFDNRGAFIIKGNRLYIDQIPFNTTTIRVVNTFQHTGNQQSNENIKFKKQNIYIGPSYGDSIEENDYPYGDCRSLITGLRLYAYPNEGGKFELLLP